jgi:DNA topoisomerase-1
MAKNLLIVESPAKAKTIEKFLGKDFVVKSSYGHIRDLDKGNNAVDIENGFEPKYIVSPEKKKVVKELKDWVKKTDEIWLATDEDREGEAISWHLCKVLGLNEHTTKRIVFREITKSAVQKAITVPRLVDLKIVNAQQARRILDRLVGFELSSILWKKVRGKLSAGRVQSVAVKLLVERERIIQEFTPVSYYKVVSRFDVKDKNGKSAILKAEMPGKFDKEGDARSFVEKCNGATFNIEDIQKKPLKRKPTAPFTTSTLQQEASKKMGFAVKRTMSAAQKLYEQGYITYMRTDSTSMSEVALTAIAEEITTQYGEEYLHTRRYKSKSKQAQEAHEAIRPTSADRRLVTGDKDQVRLYDLIWKRTVASQMTEAIVEKTTAKVGISTIANTFLTATGEVLKFEGFLKVYIAAKEDDEEDEDTSMLPPLSVGQKLDLKDMIGRERFTRASPRYSEAALVKKMEELGIGRPSTYAPTIGRITEESRGYVVKKSTEGTPRNFNEILLANNKIETIIQTENTGAVSNRLFPTDLGMIVSDFLEKHFMDVMNYSFTADIEKKFDDIAQGTEDWKQMLKDFYDPFHETVEDTIENAERASGERILGKDEETGRTVLVRMSRYGPVVQIGAPDELAEDEKPKYANLQAGQSMNTVTLEEVKDLFKLPKVLGAFEELEVSVGMGRFGPYVKHDGGFVSLPKGEDPLEVTLARALELIAEKRKADAPVMTFEDLDVTKGAGRFGPFIKWNGMFINIPRRFDPENLSDADMIELIEAKKEKEANRYIHQWGDEKIAVENGRWGPFIRFKKKSIKLAKKKDGTRMTSEDALPLTLEEVKKLIEAEIPDAFAKPKPRKKPAKKKKPAAKKKSVVKKK